MHRSYRPWELKVLQEKPHWKWRVFNHNNTLLGVFPDRKQADEEAEFYRHITGNPAYVLHEELT